MALRIDLMPKAHLRRAITRMAYQILEDHKGAAPIQVFGIHVRGYSLARTLVDELAPISPQPVTLHRIGDEAVSPDPDSYVVLVDDVLFSGTTMFKALTLLTSTVVPRTIRVAVLVDRGHRRLPIHPDFTGLVSPTKFNEHVDVVFDTDGAPDSVVLQRD
jgi:pyrimidine operon attenuation protein/uracil phosphoribosyltransferase